MTSHHAGPNRVQPTVSLPRRRGAPAAGLAVLASVAVVLLARVVSGDGSPPAPAPEPTPAPAPAAAQRALSLNLDDVLVRYERGHAEFDRAVQRVIWEDRMVRIASALAREEATARRGGLVGLPVPFTAGGLAGTVPGPDPRAVLAGPFADDWRDLSPQEKIGRLAETAVTYGLMFEILRALAGSPH